VLLVALALTACREAFAPVSGRFALVSAGNQFTCGVTTRGAAYCWGDDSYGELGDGSTKTLQQCSAEWCMSPTPVAVLGGLTFATISAGWYHTCGLTTDGVAYCWGDNYYGELGDGTTANSSLPVRAAGQP